MLPENVKHAPEPSVRRLPIYLRHLKLLQTRGREVVSCTHIANDLGLTNTQVRKDLAATGIVGKPKVGYQVPELIDAIEGFLGWDNASDAFLVGAGHLGSALLGYQGFADSGLNILAAFDADPAKIGTTIHGREVFPIEKLYDLRDRMHVHIGVLAVPGPAAQEAANQMVLYGIRAIWNFTPARLDVPDSVIVENVSLLSSLAVLTNRLREALRAEHTQQQES